MTQYGEQERGWDSAQPSGVAPISAGRAYAEVLLVFAAVFAASIISAGEGLAGRLPLPGGGWAEFTPATVKVLSDAAIAVTVVILLSARRGITLRRLGMGLPRKPGGKVAPGRILRMTAAALAALIVGAVITEKLATGHLAQPVHPTGAYFVYAVGGSLQSGVIEEMVALAFVVTTLRQARRPVAEILIVAVLLRCSYHVYYGVGVVGIAVWAAVFVFLFLRFQSVIPLIVLHFLWDTVQFLGEKWIAVAAIGELFAVLVLLAGLISGLAAFFTRQAQGNPPVVYPPPGSAPIYPPTGYSSSAYPPPGSPPPVNPPAGYGPSAYPAPVNPPSAYPAPVNPPSPYPAPGSPPPVNPPAGPRGLPASR